MDPIHPILPQPVNIPPVTRPPQVGRIDREDQRKHEQDEDAAKRRRRRQQSSDGTAVDVGSHIDVTA